MCEMWWVSARGTHTIDLAHVLSQANYYSEL